MRSPTVSISLLCVLGALVFGAAGCGSSSKSSKPAPAAASSANSNSGNSNSGNPSSSSSGAPNFASLGNCKQLADLGQKYSSALSGANTDPKAAAAAFHKMADEAPEEIRSDMQVLADLFETIVTEMNGLDPTKAAADPATMAKLQQLSAKITTPEFQKASTHLQAWAQKNCSGG